MTGIDRTYVVTSTKISCASGFPGSGVKITDERKKTIKPNEFDPQEYYQNNPEVLQGTVDENEKDFLLSPTEGLDPIYR